jgi:hypothetical protein
MFWEMLRMPWFHPLRLLNNNKAVLGIHLEHLWEPTELLRQAMVQVLHWYQQGQLDPARTFPLVGRLWHTVTCMTAAISARS